MDQRLGRACTGGQPEVSRIGEENRKPSPCRLLRFGIVLVVLTISLASVSCGRWWTANSVQGKLERALAAHRRGDFETELSIYQELNAGRGETEVLRAQAAEAAIRLHRRKTYEGNIERAITLAKARRDPSHVITIQAMYVARDHDRLESFLRTVAPDEPLGWSELGDLYQIARRRDAAKDAYREAIRLADACSSSSSDELERRNCRSVSTVASSHLDFLEHESPVRYEVFLDDPGQP